MSELLLSLPQNRNIHVLAVGHALTDVTCSVSDEILMNLAIPRGGMVLQDADASAALLKRLRDGVRTFKYTSGGSAGNTAAGLAMLGSSTVFCGRVGADNLGRAFASDAERCGIKLSLEIAPDTTPSGCCAVLITPDGERSMATFLGAAAEITSVPDVQSAALLYIEGYLWDRDVSKKTLEAVMTAAKAAGTRTVFALSDAFCVSRHRDDFKRLLRDKRIDLLFANEAELKALYAVDDIDAAIRAAGQTGIATALTRGAAGAVLIDAAGKQYTAPALRVDAPTDLTGAGDAFAAGLLHMLHAHPVEAGTFACKIAASVITQHGARLPDNFRTILAQAS